MDTLDPIRQAMKFYQKDIYSQGVDEGHRRAAYQALDNFLGPQVLQSIHSVIDIGSEGAFLKDYFLNRRHWPLDKITGVTLGKEDFESGVRNGYQMIFQDFNTIPDGEKHDLLWARHCIEHSLFPTITMFLWNRLIELGRYAIIITPAWPWWKDIPNHYHVLTPEQWAELFKRTGFTIEKRDPTDISELRFLLRKTEELK